jgi:hypothetical protein
MYLYYEVELFVISVLGVQSNLGILVQLNKEEVDIYREDNQ